ncbi:MAG: FAD:protein FMN transferase [Myxococcota bacterium]|nr:FAD:protein FMN transferase [Myxococcota bacterium]
MTDGRYVMGTVLEVTLVSSDELRARAALAEIFAEASRLESLLTTWDPESELSLLNRAAGGEPRAVSADLARILSRARGYGELTRGSFDVTVGPLVELWAEAAQRGALPTAAELGAARRRVGFQHIRVLDGPRAGLAERGVAVNLGGVAKGYAVDRMLPILARHGIENALLNFGQSSTWALGRPADGTGWRLLARGPGDEFLGVLTLEDRALSVSGSLGQWVEIGGRRYGHVLDPRTGQPLPRRLQSMVLAGDATLAEALSKAVLVLGEREGLALVEAQAGCEALLVDADGGVWRTRGWDAATRFEPTPGGV